MAALNRRRALAGLAALAAAAGGAPARAAEAEDVVGRALSPWRRGGLDIHHISTGRGDATLILGPDGTAVLIDAGAASQVNAATLPARPSGERRPGEWIARYVARRLAETGGAGLDALMVTHLHPDHTGGVAPDAPASALGAYRLTGVSDVAAQVRVRRLIDPCYPDYGFPPFEDAVAARNYIAFVRERASQGFAVERFRVGARDQIRLEHGGAAVPFEVRNLAARGVVWTGRAEETRALFPTDPADPRAAALSENAFSAAIRLRFGAFDYFIGGDLTDWGDAGANPWLDALTPAARAAGPVDAAAVPHHGLFDASGAGFVRAAAAQVWVVSAWHASHPSLSTLERLFNPRLYPGPRQVFTTDLSPAADLIGARLTQRLSSREGHVVLRVAPDGASFRVATTSSREETDRVLGVSPPIACR